MKKGSIVRAAVTAVLVLGATNLQADTFGVNFANTTGLNLGTPPSFTLGFSFTANTDIILTGLALFDSDQNGLAESHQIGLWNSAMMLLTSTTVQAGAASPLVDKFRVENVAPVLLAGGGTYFIGALFTSGSDPNIFPSDAVGFDTAPEVSFLDSQFAVGGTLSFPGSSVSADHAYFGPNFTFTTTVIPEPTTVMLLGSVMIAVGALARRKLNRS
jgi:hypothetical protein